MTEREIHRRTSAPPLPGGHLHIDATMGIAGDMFVAALLDLSLPLGPIRRALIDVGLHNIGPRVMGQHRGQQRGLYVSFVDGHGFVVDEPREQLAHHRTLGASRERTREPKPRRDGRRDDVVRVARALDVQDGQELGSDGVVNDDGLVMPRGRRVLVDEWLEGRPVSGAELLAFLRRGRLSPLVRAMTERTLRAYLEGKARAEGVEIETVQIDGRAAVDVLADVVSAMALLETIEPARITASAVGVSSAPVRSEGVRQPGPTGWVSSILRGHPLLQNDTAFECTTPTGAALVVTLARPGLVDHPSHIDAFGVGLGRANPDAHANVTRVFYALKSAAPKLHAGFFVDALLRVDVNRPAMTARLQAAGAADVSFLRAEDAHGHPLFRLQARVDDEDKDAVAMVLAHSGVTPSFMAATSVKSSSSSSLSSMMTIPLSKGKKKSMVRVRVDVDGIPHPIDEDIGRAASVLDLQKSTVSARAKKRVLQLLSTADPHFDAPIRDATDDGRTNQVQVKRPRTKSRGSDNTKKSTAPKADESE